ncbi:STAS domain-containing protein [Streptomyces sp. SKN60]|uniref:STAS domain-containing protein n=1 Tax=Streptomyces sp. SKN60 TaxID=2855506 RepID=UPI00224834D5|nr:STAS domain-containing protein [Streptomyces sp. SKN60]MCX2185744.1 STAS domain-containing protein [Streptomyces sp. SKN60]
MHLIRTGEADLAVRSSEGLTTAELYGELDLVLVQRIRPELDVLAREASALTVDLRHVTFCDASGLGLLVRCAQRVRERGAAWRLVCDQPMILRLVRLAGLDDVLCPSPPTAPPPGPQAAAQPGRLRV